MLIHPLDRKLVRDLLQMKGQVLAICLVIACGVATCIMSLSTLESLEYTRATYYNRYRFAHVFASMKRAPNSLVARIAEIPGVAQVQPRIVMDVTLNVPEMSEPAVGRLISVPDFSPPALNDVYLRSGRYLEPGSRGEVLVSEAFAAAHGFTPGDSVLAVINGRLQKLTIVGIALSPEYVFQIRPGDVLPDDRRFGVFWMGYTELAAAFDMEGAFNSISLSLMHGASEADVIQRLDNLTAPYGGIGGFGRDDQVSHRFLSDEITSLRAMGIIAPSIFLAVAAFMLNVIMSRQISLQREQIAALKAFGYTRLEIGVHYLKLVLIIVVVGTALGTLAGIWLGHDMTRMYTKVYRFPLFHFQLDPVVTMWSLTIASGAAILGTAGAVRRAMVLPPAEAMRPEPPGNYRPTFIERWGLGQLFAQTGRMILRNIERQPIKSALSCVGISMAAAIMILGNFSADAVDYLLEYQFRIVQRQDVMLSFVEPTSGGVLHEVAHLPGVMQVEPFRSVPVRLRHGHLEHRTGILALGEQRRLYRLVDTTEEVRDLPPDGIMLSEKLAELLEVERGGTVRVEVLEGERPVRDIPVTATIREFAGTNAYMSLAALHRLMREGDAVSGAYVSVDSNQIDELYTELKNTPRVAGVTIKEGAVRSFQDTFAENLNRLRIFNVIFATIIAFGVVYNTARISLSERTRELATLRVIGFTRAEISMILLGELAVLTLTAIPFGLLLGYGFAAFAVTALETEMFRIPLVVRPSTFALAASVVMIAALFSGLVVRRRLDHLDLVAVLKSKE